MACSRLARVVCVAAGAIAVTADQCQVQAEDMMDCHIGDEGSCRSAGCCWQPVDPNPSNLPWCFHRAGDVKECTLRGSPQQPFSADEVAQVMTLFEANLDIQGSGMVVAAPDHNTGPGGDYYFAWMRDGALSMHALLQVAGELTSDVEAKLDHWLSWVERSTESEAMAEPKFTIPDGKPFPGAWCRPQNDGPGLRAITLMVYAKAKPSVNDRVWPVVQKQLDWVVDNYAAEGCDLWEEIQSPDFFWGRYTMRKALLQGSAFAKDVGGDEHRASSYEDVAKKISDALADHIDEDGFVFEATQRRLDTAVIEAFNVGDMNDGVFAPLDKNVVQTLYTLAHNFCHEYELNQQAASANISGILFGRYKGDTYAGGNPWVLLTASAATLLYRQSAALTQGGKMDPDSQAKLKELLAQDVTAETLIGAGDAALNRMKTFLNNGMHMNEQLDRNTGKMLSAKDLTWNYANVLKAMKARRAAVASLQAADEQILV